MIIKFCGMPGSGKSYLARKMFRRHLLNDIKFSDKFFGVINFILRRPRSFVYLIKICLLHQYKKRMLFQVIFSIAKDYLARKRNFCVLEENFIQLGFILITKDFKRRFREYLERVPLPDKVIYVNSSERTSRRRVVKRGYDNLYKIFNSDLVNKIYKNFNNPECVDIISQYVKIETIKN